MTVLVTIDPSVVELVVGVVEATGLRIGPSDTAQIEEARQWATTTFQSGPEGGDERRRAVRQLLRTGGFKPSGRNKPAQEYLLRAAGPESQWPAIFNAVDVLNVVSLRSGLPISLIAPERIGRRLLIRYGTDDEQFVFNQSGQVLNVSGLICLCRQEGAESIPVGSPVRDSQVAKVTADDAHVLACIYAPRHEVPPRSLAQWSVELAGGLQRWCGAQLAEVRQIPETW